MVRRNKKSGFILVTTLLMMTVLLGLIGAYYTTTRIELANAKSSRDSATGFFAAEAGLNLRAEEIRQTFLGYNTPTGTSPTKEDACAGDNVGSGDFGCQSDTFGNRSVQTYVEADPDNPYERPVPKGEKYQYLNAQEHQFTVRSIARNVEEDAEAVLELKFMSRLIPLFQFAAFYNKDLEILPGANMTLNGPVHTNGDLYLNSDATLTGRGQITVAGTLYRGRKNQNVKNGTVRVWDRTTDRALFNSGSNRQALAQSDVTAWRNQILLGVDQVSVPEPEQLDPDTLSNYWTQADLRIVLRLDDDNRPRTSAYSPTGIEVRRSTNPTDDTNTTEGDDDNVDEAATRILHNMDGRCPRSLGAMPQNYPVYFYDHGGTPLSTPQQASPWNPPYLANFFFSHREQKYIRMLEVDMRGILNCLYNSNWFDTGKALDETSQGGLVFNFTVRGPDMGIANNSYGVRVHNGSQLRSNISGAPNPKGLTIISDQAMYIRGSYNDTNKIPAAFLADSINVLSGNWTFPETATSQRWGNRNASDTTINAAFLSGTDITGGSEGSGGQDNGDYNGGLENYPRFSENWSGRTFTYLGSLVSLNAPLHVNGDWVGTGSPRYNAPVRAWSYDTDFNDSAKLPPLSPRFVYLRQELFVRDYDQP